MWSWRSTAAERYESLYSRKRENYAQDLQILRWLSVEQAVAALVFEEQAG